MLRSLQFSGVFLYLSLLIVTQYYLILVPVKKQNDVWNVKVALLASHYKNSSQLLAKLKIKETSLRRLYFSNNNPRNRYNLLRSITKYLQHPKIVKISDTNVLIITADASFEQFFNLLNILRVQKLLSLTNLLIMPVAKQPLLKILMNVAIK
jgi:hypothetical protein